MKYCTLLKMTFNVLWESWELLFLCPYSNNLVSSTPSDGFLFFKLLNFVRIKFCSTMTLLNPYAPPSLLYTVVGLVYITPIFIQLHR